MTEKTDYFIPQYTNAPFTTVVNRAQMVDLSKDLRPRMGVERFQIQDIVLLPDEKGPNGETVYKPVNDYFDQVRFVGDWKQLSNTEGTFITHTSGDGSAYVEVSFYGKGLNVLGITNTANRDVRPSVDGGAEGANIYGTGYSGVLNGRNYPMNQKIPVNSGLAMDFHTVKLRADSLTQAVYALEFLGPDSQIYVPAGKYKKGDLVIERLAGGYIDYNTGIVGVKGAASVVQLNSNGSVEVKHTETEAADLYLSATDHSNEEEYNRLNARDFGAGRSDDFSILTSAISDRAFTLSDNLHNLVGDGVGASVNSLEFLGLRSNLPIIFTFEGSGLDVTRMDGGDGGTHTLEYYVDGVLKGTEVVTSSSTKKRRFKVCSGLSMGTHVVKILRTAAATHDPGLFEFITYRPSKPAISNNAIELGSYNVNATFALDTTVGNEYISTGAKRKFCAREVLYKGTWAASGINPLYLGGLELTTSTDNDELEHNFYGETLIYRSYTGANSAAYFYIDDVLLTAANFPSVTVTVMTGYTYNSTTGLVTQSTPAAQGSGVAIEGLGLDYHKLTAKRFVGAGLFYANALDIFSPISAPKFLNQVYQNEFLVGNESISDSRELQDTLPALSKAVGITTGASTNSTAIIPAHDMISKIRTYGGQLRVDFNWASYNSTNGQYLAFQIFIDGKLVGYEHLHYSFTHPGENSHSETFDVAPGDHTVLILWRVNTGTGYMHGNRRRLTLREIKG